MRATCLILLFFLGICPSESGAQTTRTSPTAEVFEFTPSTSLSPNAYVESFIPLAVGDMNQDGLDDIVRLEAGTLLRIDYQANNGLGFTSKIIERVSNGQQWFLITGDVNNDGLPDIITGGKRDQIKVYIASDSTGNFRKTQVPDSDTLFCQGANLINLNGDAYLDLYVNSDTGPNRAWVNDQLGNFIPADGLFPPVWDNGKDNSGNYASVWVDIDNDCDQDLYISRCRAGALPGDPRRINQLFIRQSDGSFVEDAQSRGLASDDQSWCSDFQDFDNDGDFDAIIANHEGKVEVFLNENGYFRDVSTTIFNIAPVVGPDHHFQIITRDMDGDGYMDLLLTGRRTPDVYRNEEGLQFKKVDKVFAMPAPMSASTADLNHDGTPDLISSRQGAPDRLWLNSKKENHWLSFKLEPQPGSLPHAVGARAFLYGPWGIQSREVRIGESYGINTSNQLYFGLGTNQQFDSLVVIWPNCKKQTITDLPIDQYWIIRENQCIAPDLVIKANGALELCEGESVELTAPAAGSWQWSNGSKDQNIVVKDPGVYQVNAAYKGCTTQSKPIVISRKKDPKPVVQYEGIAGFCEGGFIRLFADDNFKQVRWNTGSGDYDILVTQPGNFYANVQGVCGNYVTDTLSVIEISLPDTPVVQSISIPQAGGFTLYAQSNDDVYWYNSANQLLIVGPQLSLNITRDATYFVKAVKSESGISCSSKLVEVKVDVGRIESFFEPDIYITPNPVVNGSLSIHSRNLELTTLWNCAVMDEFGKLIQTEYLYQPAGQDREYVIQLKEVPPGIYFVRMSGNYGIWMDRILILR